MSEPTEKKSVPKGYITEILRGLNGPSHKIVDLVYTELYDELHRYAVRRMNRERQNHTLQPTAIVHEAWIILREAEKLQINDRKHFFRLAARCMRRIIVDYARKKNADKRGGNIVRTSLTDEGGVPTTEHSIDVLALNESLKEFEKDYPRHAEVVELRFFAGLSVEETADALDVSTKTVKRDWSFAKAWLLERLS